MRSEKYPEDGVLLHPCKYIAKDEENNHLGLKSLAFAVAIMVLCLSTVLLHEYVCPRY